MFQNEEQAIGEDCVLLTRPNMPHLPSGKIESVCQLDEYELFIVRNVPTVGKVYGLGDSPIHYVSVLTALITETNLPIFYVTLERGINQKSFLCSFDTDGTRSNYGSVSIDYDEYKFLVDAMEIVENRFDLNRAA